MPFTIGILLGSIFVFFLLKLKRKITPPFNENDLIIKMCDEEFDELSHPLAKPHAHFFIKDKKVSPPCYGKDILLFSIDELLTKHQISEHHAIKLRWQVEGINLPHDMPEDVKFYLFLTQVFQTAEEN